MPQVDNRDSIIEGEKEQYAQLYSSGLFRLLIRGTPSSLQTILPSQRASITAG